MANPNAQLFLVSPRWKIIIIVVLASVWSSGLYIHPFGHFPVFVLRVEFNIWSTAFHALHDLGRKRKTFPKQHTHKHTYKFYIQAEVPLARLGRLYILQMVAHFQIGFI